MPDPCVLDPEAITFPCARCGHPASIFTLLPSGAGEDMWRERDRLARAGFLAKTLHFGELSNLAALMAAIEQRNRDLRRSGLSKGYARRRQSRDGGKMSGSTAFNTLGTSIGGLGRIFPC
jgi:hypothetical protein